MKFAISFTWARTALVATLLALAAGSPNLAAQDARITFLHINDIYVMETKGGGGLAPLMTLLQRERARARGQALTTFGGDLISPSLMSTLTRGAHMITLMNAIGVQAAVPGNHEFDFGSEVLGRRISESAFPWLAANIRDRDGASVAGFEDSRLITLNGVRIGLFGVLSPETRTLSKPGDDVKFAAPIDSAKRVVVDLRSRGAEVVVALTHLRLETDLALARAVPGIDLVLGGHDHYPVAIARGGALVVKAGQDARHLAVVDVDIDREAGGPGTKTEIRPVHWRFLATRGVPPDPPVAALVERIRGRYDIALDQHVGETKTALDGRREVVRSRESTLGNLVADAMRAASGTDAALINGGGIRGDRVIAAGTSLTRRHILEALPFGDVTVVIEITGATLRQALEHGVGMAENLVGRFLQVSGLRIVWDRAGTPGNRIRTVTIAGAPLDPAKSYRIAVGAYIAGGGDGYVMFESAKRIVDKKDGAKVAGQLIDHITRSATIAPRVEGRILEFN